MKKILIPILFITVLLSGYSSVYANTNVHLQVETSTGTLYNQDIDVSPCDSDGVGTMLETAYCAVLQSGLANNWSWFGTDAFLNSLGGVSNDFSNNIYWGWFSNLELGQTALNKYNLSSGDSILLNYNINPLKVIVDNDNPSIGEDTKFTVTEFSYDSSFNPVWSKASGGEIVIDGNTFSLDSDGQYVWKPTSTNTVSVEARKLGFINSPSISVSPKPATEKVFIRNKDLQIYSGEVPFPVSSTVSIADKNGISHDVDSTSVLALLYSLTQIPDPSFTISNLEYYDSFGAFYIKCITPKNESEICDNWQYAVNGVTPQTSIEKTVLTGGESIGLYFGNPHQLLLDKTSINAGDSVNVTAQKYNYTDNTWSALLGVNIDVTVPNPDDIWNPTLVSETPVDQDGKAIIVFSNPGTYTIGIKEDFSFPSYPVTVITNSGGGGGGGGSPAKNSISIADASSFLSLKQKPDGSFGSSLYTDWSAVAIGALGSQAGSMKSTISDYLKNNPLNSNSLTDNERRAIALMSLGINPYDGTSVNYIDKIVKSYDGAQFGDSSLYNDDIFASIVLLNAGYSSSDEMIKKDIAFIISQQSFDGSWGSPDMTGAGLQLLRSVMNLSGVQDSITKAEAYLASAQGGDGGFLNSFSTSWALQGMSLNSSLSDKTAKADKYLALLQQTDGGVGLSTDTEENRIWATSYAVPAALHMPWSSVMESFSKPFNSSGLGSGNNNQNTNVVVKKEPIKTVEEPKDKDLEVKKEPVVKKIVKNKQIIKKEENKIENNALSASALDALGSEPVKPSIISKFINLIKSPFVWLFMKFGF